MTYQGYTARVEFDPRDNLFVGHVLGIIDRISFHGSSVDDLRDDFHQAIDFYLETSPTPQAPSAARLTLDLTPDLHCAVMIAADVAGESLDRWATEVLRRAALDVSAASA